MNWTDVNKHFENYQVVYEGRKKDIVSSRITRTGLEFSGFLMHQKLGAVILWGNEEYSYLNQFSEKERIEKISKIFSLEPPLIVLSRSFKLSNYFLEIAKKYDVTIMKTDISSSEINTLMNIFLTESLAKTQMIHGNLLEMYGKGVLILGNSGTGKSETTIELIKHNHMFIADDAIECKRVFNKIIGQAPKKFYGFIEVRGLGIINAARIFGIEKIKSSSEISVIVELTDYDPKVHSFERLGNELRYKKLFDINIPYFLVPVTPGKKTSDMIEVIVANLKLMESGYNSFKDFLKKSKEDN
ncbi:MAG: HPr kinase/phosphorylase [Mycoplasma sp.]|nr:HPr kinase/phosphorylase [Mycoplasma sp.]